MWSDAGGLVRRAWLPRRRACRRAAEAHASVRRARLRLRRCVAFEHEAAQQAVDLAAAPNLHSICVHGDSPNAVEIAQVVRRALEADGLEVRSFL